MIPATLVGGQARRQVVDVAARLRETFGMRVVRPEQHVVRADRLDQPARGCPRGTG